MDREASYKSAIRAISWFWSVAQVGKFLGNRFYCFFGREEEQFLGNSTRIIGDGGRSCARKRAKACFYLDKSV